MSVLFEADDSGQGLSSHGEALKYRSGGQAKISQQRLSAKLWVKLNPAVTSKVPERRVGCLLSTRRAAFRAAVALLLDGLDQAKNFHRAAHEIIEVAKDWRTYDSMERDAPRRAEIARMLRKVENESRRLMANLRPLSQHLDYYMAVLAPSPLLGVPEVFKLYGEADIRGIDDDPEFNLSGLSARLQALQGFCRLTLDAADKDAGNGNNWLGADSGGSTASLFKELLGSAKWQLVRRSGNIFDAYQPLTSTEGGPFHQFCTAMLELASGRSDPDETAGLKRHVQFAVPCFHRLTAMYKELRSLNEAERNMFRLRSDGVIAIRRAIWALEFEIRELQDEIERGPKSRRCQPSVDTATPPSPAPDDKTR